MDQAEAKKLFIQLLPKNTVMDYWHAQEIWASFTDGLCKDGVITQRQYETWLTPFPYGKSIIVSNNTLRVKRGRYRAR